MFFLKSLFLAAYGLTALVLTLLAAWQLMQGQWAWISPLLVWLPLWGVSIKRYFGRSLEQGDERESGVMALALAGIGLVLMTGQRDAVLWWSLGGLFALLFYLFLASRLSLGVREDRGQVDALSSELFLDKEGRQVSAEQRGVRLMLFVHSHWNPHARIAMRELLAYLQSGGEVSASQCAIIFAESIPGWAKSAQDMGCHVWYDRDGGGCQRLGLWLRGGSACLPGPEHALRPALALLPAVDKSQRSKSPPLLFERSLNFRQPPTLRELGPRIERLLERG
jgi:hypothetical protein